MGRPKCSVRRISAANLDNNSIQSTSELENPKRNRRKTSNYLAEPMQENPQHELEKVKRNLRKVHNPVVEKKESETEKPRQNLEEVSSGHDVIQRNMSSSAEKMNLTERGMSNSGEKKDTTLMVPEAETNTDLETNEELDVVPFSNEVAVESKPLMEICGKDENIPETNENLNYKNDLTSNGNLKSNKKASTENGLPSYMAATESVKAKLRLQGSPRSGQDGPQKSNSSRHHSLPSPANGKISSVPKVCQCWWQGGK